MKTQTNRSVKKDESKTKIVFPVKWLNVSVFVVFLIFGLFQTLLQNHFLLWKLQDLDVFVCTKEYWLGVISKPGGLLVYASSFLNQFFYYPWLGAILYVGFLLLISLVTAKVYQLNGKLRSFSYVPALALLWTVTQLGYSIYLIKLDGYAYVSVLGVLLVLLSLQLYHILKSNKSRLFFVATYVAIAYPLIGAYALLGALLVLFNIAASHNKDKKAWIPAAILVCSMVGIPYLLYLLFYSSVGIHDLWLINLPNYAISGAEKALWLPFILILVSFIVFSFLRSNPSKKSPRLLAFLVPTIILMATAGGVFAYSYQDKNFNTEIGMLAATEQSNWHEVLRLSKANTDEPTRLIVLNTQLALRKLGIAGDSLYQYKDGNKAENFYRTVLPVQIAGKQIYYQYGKLNFSYRWCMEEMVEYGMSVSTLKQMVLTSMLNGEYALAKKYNEVLKSTIFHRSWALEQEKYLNQPSLIAKNPDFGNILTLTAYNNTLDGDNFQLEAFLSFDFSYMSGGNPDLVELSIQYNMEQKNIKQFWPRFLLYARTHEYLPVHYQEAALLFYYLEKKVDISDINVSTQTANRFSQLLSLSQKYANYPEASVQKLYEKEFSGTYWYYYFFNKNHSYQTK